MQRLMVAMGGISGSGAVTCSRLGRSGHATAENHATHPELKPRDQQNDRPCGQIGSLVDWLAEAQVLEPQSVRWNRDTPGCLEHPL